MLHTWKHHTCRIALLVTSKFALSTKHASSQIFVIGCIPQPLAPFTEKGEQSADSPLRVRGGARGGVNTLTVPLGCLMYFPVPLRSLRGYPVAQAVAFSGIS